MEKNANGERVGFSVSDGSATHKVPVFFLMKFPLLSGLISIHSFVLRNYYHIIVFCLSTIKRNLDLPFERRLAYEVDSQSIPH